MTLKSIFLTKKKSTLYSEAFIEINIEITWVYSLVEIFIYIFT